MVTLGSHNNHPPGDLLVLWAHTTITRHGDLLVLWVHTTITRLVISWYFGFTLQSPAMWSPGPLGWHKMKSHDCSFETWSMFMCWDVVAWWIVSFLPAAATLNWELHIRDKTHVTILCPFYLPSPDRLPTPGDISEHFFFESDAAMFVHGFVFAGTVLISAMVDPDRGPG